VYSTKDLLKYWELKKDDWRDESKDCCGKNGVAKKRAKKENEETKQQVNRCDSASDEQGHTRPQRDYVAE